MRLKSNLRMNIYLNFMIEKDSVPTERQLPVIINSI